MEWSRAQGVRAAFTLVECLVVIAIIGVIMALVIPMLSSVRAESKSTVCLENLRQLHVAIETARQHRNDVLPYAAPLPLPTPQMPLVPALPQLMKAIIPSDSETWKCPADESTDSEAFGTSYVYIAGAFMLLEPPLLPDFGEGASSGPANENRVARLITQRFTNGYLRSLPIVADNGDYHAVGARQPRNALFIDGTARIVRPSDGKILELTNH